MTALDDPWLSPARPEVRLVQVPARALAALAAGHADGAERAVPGLHIDPGLATDHCRRVWQIRAAQVRERPADASWVTRLLVDSSLVAATSGAAGSGTGLGSGPAAHGGTAVGRAGFHGPPDARGMVEVGYEVVPWARRRGYARAAMDALLALARDRADVRVLRATVSPDNVASRALVASFGLVEVGEQWDDEDGLETIFEVPVV
ncbi:MAG: hypothetical protein BGO38_13630 [Cellulomonas sp. 73-145]|mgnify:CR=1 FL=1|uniref:GNAT family N-acetyltransferase n=1 Tax=Cellulomonas sp. 73-145 TaxID=1895739 RepID=UPI000927ABEC|nr:GNAT family N-acetyltransferase [Cellulomonas sp. 73-145]MBN9326655.1 GNAT family N-acetyltransferase [Cellulomonas sp.]OJV59801.1 MAG: hypothetical protein BGO38_13630 [Cellulomonas sp. 73-145]